LSAISPSVPLLSLDTPAQSQPLQHHSHRLQRNRFLSMFNPAWVLSLYRQVQETRSCNSRVQQEYRTWNFAQQRVQTTTTTWSRILLPSIKSSRQLRVHITSESFKVRKHKRTPKNDAKDGWQKSIIDFAQTCIKYCKT
jgi:hypothetical protein